MKISDDVIEAGARAMVGGDATYDAIPTHWQRECCDFARACLTAALRQMEREGVWCGRVPENKRGDDDLSAYSQGCEVGWNNALAAVHANRITGETTT